MFDFDHCPVLFECSWSQSGCVEERPTRFDRKAMLTAAGRSVMQRIFRDAPKAPLSAHADQYLHQVNEFVLAELATAFPLQTKRPRQPHVSRLAWSCIRLLRQARRHLRHTQRHTVLEQHRQAWQAWRGHRPRGTPSRIHRIRILMARQAITVGKIRGGLRQTLRKDVADFTRASFQEARAEGPEALARLLRGILQTGRSYKPARLAPAIATQQGLVTGKRETADLFGRQAERSVETSWHCVSRAPLRTEPEHLCLSQIPSMFELANAFSSLKRNNATAMLGIPAEAYMAAPLEAAECHWPLLPRAACGREAPTLHKGGLIKAIPKPNKPPSSVTGWRNVLLQEPAAKAIGRSFGSRSQCLPAAVLARSMRLSAADSARAPHVARSRPRRGGVVCRRQGCLLLHRQALSVFRWSAGHSPAAGRSNLPHPSRGSSQSPASSRMGRPRPSCSCRPSGLQLC